MTRLTLVATLKQVGQDLENLADQIRQNTMKVERQIEIAENLIELAATLKNHAALTNKTVIEVDLNSIQTRGQKRTDT